jgi:hypothetical protein
MIVDLILLVVYYLVYGVLLLITTVVGVVIPSDWVIQIENTWHSLGIMSKVFPIATLGYFLSGVFALETALMTYKAIRWGYQKIPGIN